MGTPRDDWFWPTAPRLGGTLSRVRAWKTDDRVLLLKWRACYSVRRSPSITEPMMPAKKSKIGGTTAYSVTKPISSVQGWLSFIAFTTTLAIHKTDKTTHSPNQLRFFLRFRWTSSLNLVHPRKINRSPNPARPSLSPCAAKADPCGYLWTC